MDPENGSSLQKLLSEELGYPSEFGECVKRMIRFGKRLAKPLCRIFTKTSQLPLPYPFSQLLGGAISYRKRGDSQRCNQPAIN
jgi:hypothetical protein